LFVNNNTYYTTIVNYYKVSEYSGTLYDNLVMFKKYMIQM